LRYSRGSLDTQEEATSPTLVRLFIPVPGQCYRRLKFWACFLIYCPPKSPRIEISNVILPLNSGLWSRMSEAFPTFFFFYLIYAPCFYFYPPCLKCGSPTRTTPPPTPSSPSDTFLFVSSRLLDDVLSYDSVFRLCSLKLDRNLGRAAFGRFSLTPWPFFSTPPLDLFLNTTNRIP